MVKGKFQIYFPYEKDIVTYSCLHCRAHLARHGDLISKSFQGSQGRAYLFNNVVNVRCAEAKQRVLLTGLHFVADIFCICCDASLGWKYERAFEPSQRYKEGKFIVELIHLVKDNCWNSEWLYQIYSSNNSLNYLNIHKPNLVSNYPLLDKITKTFDNITSTTTSNENTTAITIHNNNNSNNKNMSKFYQSSLASCSLSTDCGIFDTSTTNLIDSNGITNSDCDLNSNLNNVTNNSDSISVYLSSSLNATGWAFQIPSLHHHHHDLHLDPIDSGNASDSHLSLENNPKMGHTNLLCNSDSMKQLCDNLSNQLDQNHMDNEHKYNTVTNAKTSSPSTVKTTTNSITNRNKENYSSFQDKRFGLDFDFYEIGDSVNLKNKLDNEFQLGKLSSFLTPQTKRISKLNARNLKLSVTSTFTKCGRKNFRHYRRASSVSPSRDYLLSTTPLLDTEIDNDNDINDNNNNNEKEANLKSNQSINSLNRIRELSISNGI